MKIISIYCTVSPSILIIQISVGNPINRTRSDQFSKESESEPGCRHYLPFLIMIKTLPIQSEPDTVHSDVDNWVSH